MKIAILVNKAVLLEIIMPAPGLIKLIFEELITEADRTNILVIINNSFLFSDLYFFLYYSLSILRDFNIFS